MVKHIRVDKVGKCDGSQSEDGFNSSLAFEFMVKSHAVSTITKSSGLVCFHTTNEANKVM